MAAPRYDRLLLDVQFAEARMMLLAASSRPRPTKRPDHLVAVPKTAVPA